MDLHVAGLDLGPLLPLAREAGALIMPYYHTQAGARSKADGSPVTEADLASSDVILAGLAAAYPGVPIISEEAENAPYEERSRSPLVFIVDPLDGTREFLAENGEFTVNIALAEAGRAVFGLLYAPAADRLYCGGRGLGAWRVDGRSEPRPIHTAQPGPGEPPVVLLSRSHPDPGIDELIAPFEPCRRQVMGGSLKFAAVAEGAAHVYPRARALREWDIAAGHALIEGAGGVVLGLDDEPLRYNTRTLWAGPFLATAWGACL